MSSGIVYLLHFERPISAAHTCQHYTGWALDLNARMTMHRKGKGSRLTQIAVERGIGFEVVRTWEGTRDLERYIKNRKDAPRLCPMCCQIHGWRQPRPVNAAIQLALPFDEGMDFPAPLNLPMDSYEFLMLRRWRLSRPAPAVTLDLMDDLL